jgi:hypothetical protein
MRDAREPRYILLWKGRQSEPFPLGVIREKLRSGEISRMHQVNCDGKWMVLDEFLEQHGGGDPEAQRREEARKREDELRSEYESKLAAERAQQGALQERLAAAENRSSLAHLLPPQPQYFPPPPPPPPAVLPTSPTSGETPARTSGLAIAALVMGLCNFVPILNLVTWILALVFGHVALSQMKRDHALEGRGMAIAGLIITYFLLVLGLTYAGLMLASNQRPF